MSFLNTTQWNKIRYSLYAPFYDLIGRPLQPYRRRAIALLDPKPEQNILIVGAGTGLDLHFLRSVNHITLTDIAPPMVRRIERRAASLSMSVTAMEMDAQHLDFPDRSFDAVVCHLILAVVPDASACIREVSRVLKPGGRISVFDKFLRHGTQPSLVRQLLNPVTSALFSEINRQAEPLMQEAGFVVLHDEPVLLNGMFRILLAEKR
jgi:phosphatidylethanolamine/phosphatidyl-N-methylethanolamine N-methyltransferase